TTTFHKPAVRCSGLPSFSSRNPSMAVASVCSARARTLAVFLGLTSMTCRCSQGSRSFSRHRGAGTRHRRGQLVCSRLWDHRKCDMCYRVAETQAARCRVAHVLTPGSSELLDAPVPPRYFTLQLAAPAATKANPAKAGGTKPRVLASSATPAELTPRGT